MFLQPWTEEQLSASVPALVKPQPHSNFTESPPLCTGPCLPS